ncbi:MAG: hypothetical protein AAFX94_16545 [Myxococcota bacterium]
MSWWKRLFGGGAGVSAATRESDEAEPAAESDHAEWMEVGAPGNPYDVRILNLMVTQTVMATSSDPAAASRSVSWGVSTGEELDPSLVLAQPARPCALEFPCASELPDAKTHAGHTPFHIACALGHLEAAQCLEALGADLTIPSAAGESAIEMARSENQPAVVQWLESR